ncbi:YlaF family protein [Bacillus tianshenii]|nr:YlaF family protein [Bacillus tianshenii]
MQNIKWPLLGYALAVTACFIAVGFAIGAKSIVGIIVFILAAITFMGLGFKTKKKYRDEGKL